MAHPYNTQPPYWREITDEEFALDFFQYLFKEPESRQMYYDSDDKKLEESISRVKLFPILYSRWEGLGIAIAYTEGQIKFFRYGDPKIWKEREHAFIAQFANDNS
jgi:hypothetical protein